MPFLGSTPADQYQSLAKQTITGDGSTAYTLNRSVTNAYDMEVFINNVRQEPDTSYTASGNTITFTAAVTSGDSCYLIYQGQSVGSINPPANSVGSSQVANNTITTAHLHTGLNIATSKLTGDIPYANMPVGSVIQVQETSNNTTQSTSSTNPIVILSISITPKLTSSKMILMGSTPVSVSVGTSNAYASTYIYDPGGNQLARSITGQAGYNSDQHALFAVHSPGSTSSQTYTFSLGSSSGGTGSVSTDGQTYNFIIMEIAQ